MQEERKMKFDSHFNSLYKEMFDEVAKKFKYHYAVEMFKNVQVDYAKNVELFFRKKCDKEYKWIEENSVSKGLFMPKDNVDKNEYNERLHQLEMCVNKNDNGFNKPLNDFANEYKEFKYKLNNELEECAKMKNDNDIRQCIKDKLIKHSDTFLNIFSKYKAQMIDISPSLKL